MSLSDTLVVGVIGVMFALLIYFTVDTLRRAPLGYEDSQRGFVNLDEAPDYVPNDIMELPDLTWDYEYVTRPLFRPYDWEEEGL